MSEDISKKGIEVAQERWAEYGSKEKDVEVQVYYPAEIKTILGISKSRVYTFLAEVYKQKDPPFKVIKIGKLFRVPKRSFDEWLTQSA